MHADITHMPSTPLSPWSTTSRNLLNRLSLLKELRSPWCNLTDFHIRLDEPYRKYSPGDTVKGTVVLTIVKPVRITHLTVCLHGFLRVFKNNSHANEPFANPSLSTSHKPRKSPCLRNGHASLFKDELTLCGEGLLDMGIYELKFELVFPPKGLPTSIDFERGTISYLITATVTRPTPVNATSSCNRKIPLVETIDIAEMIPPKPRSISLASFAHKPKKKRSSQRGQKEITASSEQHSKFGSELSLNKDKAEDPAGFCGKIVNEQAPHINTRSSGNQNIKSAENNANSSEGSESSAEFDLRGNCSGSTTLTPKAQVSKRSLKDQKITATIELLKSGYLPGDNIPVKINIRHRKPIRSMYGAIITLYRLGRIDSTPCHALTPNLSDKEVAKWKHEEYYPKSKSGLKGLSLNSAGSSSIFRKDLAQTFAPIIIDPNTLTAAINTLIRVPEHVFPTIKGVPGEMITFKYNLEIVLDLGGILSGQQSCMSLPGTVSIPLSVDNRNWVGAQTDYNPKNILTVCDCLIVATDTIKREKNVVASTFEVTVGSKDSVRSRKIDTVNHDAPVTVAEDGQRREEMVKACPFSENHPIFEASPNSMRIRGELDYRDEIWDHASSYQDGKNNQYPESFSNEKHHHNHHESSHDHPPPAHSSVTSILQPEISDDEILSEKERVKRAEERFLPSSPSLENNTSFSLAHSPMVPPIISGDEIHSCYNLTSETSLTAFYVSGMPSNPSPSSRETYEDNLLGSSGQNIFVSDDKYELERQRLLAKASSPFTPEDATYGMKNGESCRRSSGSGSMVMNQYPSAPVLQEEEDEPNSFYVSMNLPSSFGCDCESPPRYEK